MASCDIGSTEHTVSCVKQHPECSTFNICGVALLPQISRFRRAKYVSDDISPELSKWLLREQGCAGGRGMRMINNATGEVICKSDTTYGSGPRGARTLLSGIEMLESKFGPSDSCRLR